MRHFLSFFSALVLGLSVASAQTAPSYKTDPKFAASIAEGKKLAAQQRFAFAIDAYKKANKIAGGKDLDCLDQIFNLQIRSGEYKDAVRTAAICRRLLLDPPIVPSPKAIAVSRSSFTLAIKANRSF